MTPDQISGEETADRKKSEVAGSPCTSQPEIRATFVLPDTVAVKVSLQDVPKALSSFLEQLVAQASKTQPSGKKSALLKDFGFPLLTAAITFAALYIPYQLNKSKSIAELSQARTQPLSTFLAKDSNQATVQEKDQSKFHFQAAPLDLESARALAAMNLAEHGDDALPSLKMALGSDEWSLRHGAVLTLEQMYRAGGVDRSKLFEKVLGYYSDNNSDLRRGALEWFEKMQQQLPLDDQIRVFETLKKSFGLQAENCNQQSGEVSLEAARFLFDSPIKTSAPFLIGMVKNCNDNNARIAAVNALPVVAKLLYRQERVGISGSLQQLLLSTTGNLNKHIDVAIKSIDSIDTP